MSTTANIIRSLITDPKARRFALLGAAGCLVGAVLGELLLAATRSDEPPVPSQAVCLLIDCSGSMTNGEDGSRPGEKLKEVKAAATGFVDRHSKGDSLIAVVGFGRAVHRSASLTTDEEPLHRAIIRLSDGGSTAMDLGLEAAADELSQMPKEWRDEKIPKAILLFTDGQPDDKEATLKAAEECRGKDLRIVAIGTGDSEDEFLAQVTGDAKTVFHTDTGDFDQGFKQAEKAIYGGSLVEAGSHRGSFLSNLARTAGWSMLAACGLSLALVAGQNLYVHRAALTGREGTIAALGGLAAGLAGGALGQGLYAVATTSAAVPVVGALAAVLVPLGRLVGWTVLGTLVGWGLSFFVPNLAGRKAALGGALGGVIGGLAFLIVSRSAGAAGALGGAAILGAAIGLMLALVEAAFRQAWLEVHYGAKEVITVSLGADPVKIGSDGRACQVYARGARPLACQYTLKDGHVECVDFATERSHVVQPDEEQDVGSVKVVVRASRHAAALAGDGHPSAPGMRAAPPPPPRVNRP
ncbi:MAG TPA: vWA domain-containing protein, partial [Pirellulales bacterium]|nr:vWA domain-containing protein [Pirellulales bacterium]